MSAVFVTPNVMDLPDSQFVDQWDQLSAEERHQYPVGFSRYEKIMGGAPTQSRSVRSLIAPDRMDDDEPQHEVAPPVRRPLSAITLKTARQLHGESLRELEQVIAGLLPEGAHLLAGRPKVGKSWWALHAALAVAQGKPFLGFKTIRGDVLYLALEDSDRRMKARMAKLLPDIATAWPDNFEYATEWPTLDQDGAERVIAWLEKHPQARLVVIDVLAKIKSARGRDEGIYDADYRVTNAIKRMVARRPGVAVLVITHLRKQGAEDPLDLVTGSAGLTGGFDGALVLDRARGKGEAVLHRISRDLEDTEPLGLIWDDALTIWRIAGSAEEMQAGAERRAILAAIREAGEPMLPSEIADAARMPKASVRHLIRKMEKAGMVKRIEGKSSRHRYGL